MRCVHPATCPPGTRQPILAAQCSRHINKLILLSVLVLFTLNIVDFPLLHPDQPAPQVMPCPTHSRRVFPSSITCVHYFNEQERSIRLPHPPALPCACLLLFHVLHTAGFAFQCLFSHGTSRPVPSWYILHHFCFLTIQTGARIKATPPPTLTSASLHLSISALLLPCPLMSLCYKTCMNAC